LDEIRHFAELKIYQLIVYFGKWIFEMFRLLTSIDIIIFGILLLYL